MQVNEKDRKMMSNPKTWPNWPLLPVKRETANGYEVGVIAAIKGQLTWVYLCNFWGLVAKSESMKDARILKYNSLDELLAAGWIVD